MDDTERFTALYDRNRMRLWAYAASRVGGGTADEVVSETFMVAWRRFADMPSAELPWLLGVARKVIRDTVRAQVQRDSLATELRRWTEEPAADVAEGVIDRLAMLRAPTARCSPSSPGRDEPARGGACPRMHGARAARTAPPGAKTPDRIRTGARA